MSCIFSRNLVGEKQMTKISIREAGNFIHLVYFSNLSGGALSCMASRPRVVCFRARGVFRIYLKLRVLTKKISPVTKWAFKQGNLLRGIVNLSVRFFSSCIYQTKEAFKVRNFILNEGTLSY